MALPPMLQSGILDREMMARKKKQQYPITPADRAIGMASPVWGAGVLATEANNRGIDLLTASMGLPGLAETLQRDKVRRGLSPNVLREIVTFLSPGGRLGYEFGKKVVDPTNTGIIDWAARKMVGRNPGQHVQPATTPSVQTQPDAAVSGGYSGFRGVMPPPSMRQTPAQAPPASPSTLAADELRRRSEQLSLIQHKQTGNRDTTEAAGLRSFGRENELRAMGERTGNAAMIAEADRLRQLRERPDVAGNLMFRAATSGAEADIAEADRRTRLAREVPTLTPQQQIAQLEAERAKREAAAAANPNSPESADANARLIEGMLQRRATSSAGLRAQIETALAGLDKSVGGYGMEGAVTGSGMFGNPAGTEAAVRSLQEASSIIDEIEKIDPQTAEAYRQLIRQKLQTMAPTGFEASNATENVDRWALGMASPAAGIASAWDRIFGPKHKSERRIKAAEELERLRRR